MSVTGVDEEGLTAEQRSRRDDLEFDIEDPDDVSDGPGVRVATAEPVELAGVIDGMPDVEYHAHPALSYSGAKLLLPPGCPALFHYQREHGRPPKAAFDFGHAAHAEALGVGEELVVVEAADWRTKAAQQLRDEARARGAVPILQADHRRVREMASRLRSHPLAAALFDAQRGGRAEVSLFSTDPRTGVRLRGRLDWLPPMLPDGRIILADYKSCVSAEPEAIRRNAWTFRYFQQDPWYRALVRALDLGDPRFVFVFQEKDPPYLVSVVELDDDFVRMGRARNERAIEVYAECVEAATWPGYTSEDYVELIRPPAWAQREM